MSEAREVGTGGWSNRETEMAALWLGDSASTMRHVTRLINQARRMRRADEDLPGLPRLLAGLIEEWADEQLAPLHPKGLAVFNHDLWLWRESIGSMWRVDWTEIALDLLEEDAE